MLKNTVSQALSDRLILIFPGSGKLAQLIIRRYLKFLAELPSTPLN